MKNKRTKETPVSWTDARSKDDRRRRAVVVSTLSLAFFVVLCGAARFVVYSSFFRVNDIEITGNRMVSEQDVKDLIKADIYGGSFVKRALGMTNMLIWPGGFSGKDLRFLPELSYVSIAKDYKKKKITVNVTEKQPYGAWCIHGPASDGIRNPPECFWFDSDGVVFRRSADMEGNLVTVVDDYYQKKIGLNFKILPDRFMANIFSVFRAVDASGLRIKDMRIDDLDSEEMKAGTYDGPDIYFSMRFPADNIPDAVKKIKGDTVFGKLQYIDFRVENRVYYK